MNVQKALKSSEAFIWKPLSVSGAPQGKNQDVLEFKFRRLLNSQHAEPLAGAAPLQKTTIQKQNSVKLYPPPNKLVPSGDLQQLTAVRQA